MPHNYKSTSILAIMLIVASAAAQNITEQITTLPTITTTPTPSQSSTILPNSSNNHTLIPAAEETTIPVAPKLLQELPSSSEKPPDVSSTTPKMPPDCSNRTKKHVQPINTPDSRLRKCCPLGESLVLEENDDQVVQICKAQDFTFKPDVISVELYGNCIEDLEIPVNLDIAVGNPCENGLQFSMSNDDRMYVVQDGSLLLMNLHSNLSYTMEKEYCLDTNYSTGELYAIVCEAHSESLVATILYTTMLVISILSLFWVSLILFKEKEKHKRETLNSLIVGVMCVCLAIAFILHTLNNITKADSPSIAFTIRFFLLSYFFWMLSLCFNITAYICYILPNKCVMSYKRRSWIFQIYCLLAFSVPFALVLWTNFQELPGTPYYFSQDLTESVRQSQSHFIHPVSIVLTLCFVLIVVALCGYRHLHQINFTTETYKPLHLLGRHIHVDDDDEAYKEADTFAPLDLTRKPIHVYDQLAYKETKKYSTRFCCLYVVTLISWFFVLLTFYFPGLDSYLLFMDIINNWQGLFILMIFVLPRQKKQGRFKAVPMPTSCCGSNENSESPTERR